MKAYFRKSDLERGYVPIYLNTHESEELIDFDWSKSYDCWQPDCFDELLDDYGYNMVVLIPNKEKHFLVWVNSIDFDFEE
jgi:hypothetical protein